MGFGKDGKGTMIRENVDVALGALAADAVIKTTSLAIEEDFRILRSEIYARVTAFTAADLGGLVFGIANGELSVAEISEAILRNGPVDRNDRRQVEFVERNVKILSGLQTLVESPIVPIEWTFQNESGGPIIVSKHRWTYSNPEGWTWFIYNDSGGALTTGAELHVIATHFGVWVT